MQTQSNGKLVAALEGVLARLDLPEDTQDLLEQTCFDDAKSVAAYKLCIPEHGRMCVHDVKGLARSLRKYHKQHQHLRKPWPGARCCSVSKRCHLASYLDGHR